LPYIVPTTNRWPVPNFDRSKTNDQDLETVWPPEALVAIAPE
jgi:hypothetical protein